MWVVKNKGDKREWKDGRIHRLHFWWVWGITGIKVLEAVPWKYRRWLLE